MKTRKKRICPGFFSQLPETRVLKFCPQLETLVMFMLLSEQSRGRFTWSVRVTWCPRTTCWRPLLYSVLSSRLCCFRKINITSVQIRLAVVLYKYLSFFQETIYYAVCIVVCFVDYWYSSCLCVCNKCISVQPLAIFQIFNTST